MRLRKLWILVLLVALMLLPGLTGGCVSYQDIEPADSGITISPSLAYSLIQENKNNPDFVILDIRTSEEYDNEHIAESVMLDFYADDFKDELDELDKSKTYLVYCRSGNRSGQSMPIMEDLGFMNVYDMGGGINQWKAEGYPTVK